MLEDLLRAEAQALHRTYDGHDTEDFMRRLAVRIAQDAARPSRVTRAVLVPASQPSQLPPPPAAAACARMLGFTCDRHLPQPVRPSTHLAEGFARAVPWGTALSTFIKTEQLPRDLVTR